MRIGVRLLPGQSHTVTAACKQRRQCVGPFQLSLVINYTVSNSISPQVSTTSLAIQHRCRDEPFTVTYMDVDGTVTKAVAVAPRREGPERSTVILALHGAGVDLTAGDEWSTCLPQLEHHWMIFPTGRTPWSNDWHALGRRSANQAVLAIQSVLPEAFANYAPMDISRLFLLGRFMSLT